MINWQLDKLVSRGQTKPARISGTQTYGHGPLLEGSLVVTDLSVDVVERLKN